MSSQESEVFFKQQDGTYLDENNRQINIEEHIHNTHIHHTPHQQYHSNGLDNTMNEQQSRPDHTNTHSPHTFTTFDPHRHHTTTNSGVQPQQPQAANIEMSERSHSTADHDLPTRQQTTNFDNCGRYQTTTNIDQYTPDRTNNFEMPHSSHQYHYPTRHQTTSCGPTINEFQHQKTHTSQGPYISRPSHHTTVHGPPFEHNTSNNNYRNDVYATHDRSPHDGNFYARIPRFPHTMKPDTYDGSQSYEQYASHFQDCAELSGWDLRTKVLMLASCLRGQARTYYMSLSDNERRDYWLLNDRLRQRFGSSRHQSLWLSRLENRRRAKGESIASLGDDLRQLAQKAYFDLDGRAQERLALNQLYKLIAVEMKCRCIDNNCESVTDAISVIEKYESIIGDHHTPYIRLADTNKHTPNSISELSSLMQRIESRLSKIEMSNTTNSTQQTTSNQRLCFGCKSPDHLWRNCPSKQKGHNSNRNRNFTPPQHNPTYSSLNDQTSSQKNRNYSPAFPNTQHVSEN